MTNKIGIIGYGVVGKAAVNTFSKVFDIVKYDKYQSLDDFDDLMDCDFIFIMVPTPFDCNLKKVDDSAVVESLSRLDSMKYKGIVVIKSTVPPNSCEKYVSMFNLDIVFNPEFLRESTTPNEDFENQDTIVIGSTSSTSFESVKDMYMAVAVPNANYYNTTLKEAEMIKCAQNTMLASRVALANIIYDACQQNDIDYNRIREIAFDRFKILGPHMVQVPGPDGQRGFGGKCLPKDIRAFSTICNSDLLKDIIAYNDNIRDDLEDVLLNYKKN